MRKLYPDKKLSQILQAIEQFWSSKKVKAGRDISKNDILVDGETI